MEIGGVILGAGTVMAIAAGDYLNGDSQVRFLVQHIVGTRHERNADWIILDGVEQPTPVSGWRPRRIQVRVSALSRSLTLV